MSTTITLRTLRYVRFYVTEGGNRPLGF